MNNIKNLVKVLLALGLLALMLFLAFFAFLTMLGVASLVAIVIYVKSILPSKNGGNADVATYYYEANKDEAASQVIEGEVIGVEKLAKEE